MILNAYSLFDIKALIYSPPFFAHNHDVARRIVADTAADVNTSIGRHPNDYILYCIGVFDDQNGGLGAVDPRQHVADVVSLVPSPAPSMFDQSALRGMSSEQFQHMLNGAGRAPDTLSPNVVKE